MFLVLIQWRRRLQRPTWWGVLFTSCRRGNLGVRIVYSPCHPSLPTSPVHQCICVHIYTRAHSLSCLSLFTVCVCFSFLTLPPPPPLPGTNVSPQVSGSECASGGGVVQSVLRLQYSNWRRVERMSHLGTNQQRTQLLDDHVRNSIVNDVTLSSFNGYNNPTPYCWHANVSMLIDSFGDESAGVYSYIVK